MSNEEKPCDDCGQVHEEGDLFTDEIRALFKRFQEEKDPVAKEMLLEDMGLSFMDRIEPGNDAVPEPVHEMIEEAKETRARHEAVLARLGRTVVRTLKYHEMGARMMEHIQAHAPAISPSRPSDKNRTN
jgi:hypothetical protein